MKTEAMIDSKQEVRQAARRLLDAAGVQQPPVDLVAVARLQGIDRIHHRKMTKTLGTLREGKDGLTVTLNRREPYRARFTLAHEIAHTMVDPPRVRDTAIEFAARTPRSGDELERFCDEIAVELLLPYDLFRDAMPSPLSLGSLYGLAKQFDASLQATALRAGELANEPVQVVVWERSGRKGIRVKATRGRDFLTGAGADDDRSLEDGTPIARAFLGSATEEGVELPSPESPLVYDCEARGFLRGDSRFVISVVRPQTVLAGGA